MEALTMRSYAKINLSLDVLGRLPNGYHEIKTIMQTVSLHDVIRITKRDAGISVASSLKFLPTDGENLAYAAAEAFFRETKIAGGAEIYLEKHIPVGAGLAGGSGNAAAVLAGLNRLYEAKLPKRKLCEIGEKLGADVPYCLLGGTRLAEGIGEKLSRLPSLPDCHIVLVKPRFSVSTKWAYENLDARENLNHPDSDALIAALREGDLKGVCAAMGNVLEEVTMPHHPMLVVIKDRLYALGALGAMMSGSGPTVFAIFDDEEKASEAKREMRADYGTAYVCRVVNSCNY